MDQMAASSSTYSCDSRGEGRGRAPHSQSLSLKLSIHTCFPAPVQLVLLKRYGKVFNILNGTPTSTCAHTEVILYELYSVTIGKSLDMNWKVNLELSLQALLPGGKKGVIIDNNYDHTSLSAISRHTWPN